MRPADEDLIADYIADLEVDIRCADRDGQIEYAAACRAELAALRNASAIKVDRWGVPHPAG